MAAEESAGGRAGAEATPYRRVDLERLAAGDLPDGTGGPSAEEAGAARSRRVRLWLVLPLSIALCVFQACVTILAANFRSIYLTSTMIPVLTFGVLFILVLAANPFLRLVDLGRYFRAPAEEVWIGVWAATTTAVCAVLVSWLFWIVFALVVAGGAAYVALTGKLKRRDLVCGGGALGCLLLSLIAAFATGSSVPLLVLAAVLVVATVLFVGTLARAELVAVFCAMLVTAGVSTYGLTAQLVPLIGAPWNPEWNTPQRGWGEHVLPHLRRELYLTDPETVRAFREGLPVPAPAESAPRSERLAYYGEVFRGVPWGAWTARLACWMVFVFACYGAFYFLAYIVLGYWSEREKLIFPLAKLPEALVPERDEARRWLPRIFSSPGFWAGFAVSFLVLSYNAAVSAEWIAGLGKIRLGMPGWRASEIVEGGFLQGLGGGSLMFLVIFTAIGVSFLLPLEISFSAWFYVVVGNLVLLFAVWMGYGQNTSDFPTNWLWMNNPVSAQGAGAMLLFSGISLYRSIREYARLAAGRSGAERLKLLVPVIGLGVCLLVMTAWLSWNRLGVVWSFVVVVFLTLITVGLMRIVAEGGIYWFQSHASFFHSYKMLGLGRIMAPVLVGPLLLIYSVLFLDIKTFMAPELLHAAKLREGSGASRAKFHVNIAVCIAVTVAFSLAFAIFAAHVVGAQQMCRWFYSMAPQQFVDTAHRAATTPPEFQGTTVFWYGVGATWLAVSMFLRRTLFWFPHPIGYIMLVNPLMAQLWFSFFLGWVCKKVVVKYGGKSTFDRVRVIFIGLIIGELMAAFTWNVLSLGFGFTVQGLDLNRYGA